MKLFLQPHDEVSEPITFALYLHVAVGAITVGGGVVWTCTYDYIIS